MYYLAFGVHADDAYHVDKKKKKKTEMKTKSSFSVFPTHGINDGTGSFLN